jgi:hypothetical protein
VQLVWEPVWVASPLQLAMTVHVPLPFWPGATELSEYWPLPFVTTDAFVSVFCGDRYVSDTGAFASGGSMEPLIGNGC